MIASQGVKAGAVNWLRGLCVHLLPHAVEENTVVVRARDPGASAYPAQGIPGTMYYVAVPC